jgi:hypothetical protein
MMRTSGVLIPVCDKPLHCPLCRGPWHVQKSVPHLGRTIAQGYFKAQETVHVCANRCRYDSGKLVTRRAASLTKHLIPGMGIGYDVMTYVGLQRFLYHRQREEIRSTLLNEHGISVSSGTISNLAKLFLGYLRELHNSRSDQLQDTMVKDGGWPLHIDATGEDGRGTMLVAFSGWRQWVLGSWKIPTENVDAILPCLHEVVNRFGSPCSIMRDLGRAMIPAANSLVDQLELNIPVLACHLHFLKDIGKDLLDPAYGELRGLFRRYKICPKLRLLSRELGRKLGTQINDAREGVKAWQKKTDVDHRIPHGMAGVAAVRALTQRVLDFKADGTGYDYPFDRPFLDLYDRCKEVRRAIDAFIHSKPSDPNVLKYLKRLHRILGPVASEVPFQQTIRRLRYRATLLDELRDALRLSPKKSKNGYKMEFRENSSPDQSETTLRDIQKQVKDLELYLKESRPKRGPAKDNRSAVDLILRHFKNHGDYLWGHVINLPDDTDGDIRLVDRTNNILERFFRGMKQKERRRSGRKILTQDFEHLPPEAALVYNLKCTDYVSIVCGSLDHLHDAFSEMDMNKASKNRGVKSRIDYYSNLKDPKIETASLPTKDRKLIRTDQMQRRIAAAAKSRAPHYAP